ncbi:MAG: spermidine synthase [Candidatus Riflebacteria bacterium]|nr:spermidine synthase [Candidatus Riflebacteria bacterium]
MTYALLLSVFVIATCGLVYELVAATLASYLLGDSITQFSTVIGTYLFSMGIGAYLSRFIGKGMITRFVQIEIAVGIIGGLSAALLFLSFSYTQAFRLILYLVVIAIGTLVGLEIPLLLRILKGRLEFHDLVSQVLTFDYLGALAASLAFPIVLVPKLGLVQAALFFGLANVAVALWSLHIFGRSLPHVGFLRFQCLDQRIAITRWRDDIRLFLNGHLQFSSRDEYRYHEALVHPALAAVPCPRKVAVLGGGDGLAVREILRYPQVQEIRLVDLDPEMTRLFSTHELLVKLNGGALKNPRVKVVNQDAFLWLDHEKDMFDAIIVDLPDPSNFSLGKLYTTAFYRLVARHLSRQGVATVQSTSPLFARRSFWCIGDTIKSAGLRVTPLHAYVPSFGEWGFNLASHEPYRPPTRFPPGLKYLTPGVLGGLLEFPPDMVRLDVEVNRLNNQILVGYHDAEWREILK